MKRTMLAILALILLGCASIKHKKNATETDADTIQPEYCLELIDGEFVKIHSHLSGKMYLTRMENIQDVLLDDNI